jgi:hypothetical protein
MKLIGGKQAREMWSHYHLPSWFRVVTGAVEVVGAIGLMAGIWMSALTLPSVALIGVTMIGAIYSHFALARDGVRGALPATILLVLTAALGVGV